MHLDRVEGGKDRGPPGEIEPCPGVVNILVFPPGGDEGNQDRKIANAECNTIFDGAWDDDVNKGIKRGKKEISCHNHLTNRKEGVERNEKDPWRVKWKRGSHFPALQ